jgi:hypothetical protein
MLCHPITRKPLHWFCSDVKLEALACPRNLFQANYKECQKLEFTN